MIGKVIYRGGEVVLSDDGQISAPDPRLQKLYQMKYDLYRSEYSPAHGALGYQFLSNVAHDLGGQVEVEKKKPPPPGAIF